MASPKSPTSPRLSMQGHPGLAPATARSIPRSQSRMSSSSRLSGDDDGKTAVKVAIRVRPPLEPGQPGYELIPQRFQRSIVQVTSQSTLSVESPQGKRTFVFDRVFNEDISQEGVMQWLGDSVDSFVTGYNVSLLAYGQSGSGKSYTMGTSGPNEQNDPWQMGVIPRAARQLFEKLAGEGKPTHTAKTLSASGIRPPSRMSTQVASPLNNRSPKSASKPAIPRKDWSLKATYVEIYNDELRDLLIPEEFARQGERLPVTIREDPKGNILLTGLREIVINDVEDLLAALNYGSSIRQTDATAINARSSRSHAVFSLSLVQKRRKTLGNAGKSAGVNPFVDSRRWTIAGDGALNHAAQNESNDEAVVKITSKLHFVDLAGSERLKNTGAQGERAKEGISINAGLAALGKVISQLSARGSGSGSGPGHISYRDSKLTRLLSDSLGGNAITYMIACVTPAEFHRSETLNTIQYAQRARAIQSRPQISEILDEAELRAVVDRLKAEVASLREQLRRNAATSNVGPDDHQTQRNTSQQEQELQEQLLDLQESYAGLSARHAKLIAEISKDRGVDVQDFQVGFDDDDPNSSMNRIKRSSSFAEAVETVILEYEKTIQSLESSLSTVRASLSATESTLLEKESKLAYAENINQQLQARVSKLTQRESAQEELVRKLQFKFDSATVESAASPDQAEISETISELRQENAKLRDNEQSSEAYLAVLEENLAEADSDIEFWKREVDRLERIVERQRGLRKLDTLLDELDEVQQEALHNAERESIKESDDIEITDGITKEANEIEEATAAALEENGVSDDVSVVTEPIPAAVDEDPSVLNENGRPSLIDAKLTNEEVAEGVPLANVDDHLLRAELSNLRKSHEATVRKLEDLSQQYNSSLECITELKGELEKEYNTHSQQSPTLPAGESNDEEGFPDSTAKDVSFLEHAGVRNLKTAAIAEALLAAGPQRSFSRSLSSEHSSAGVLDSGNITVAEDLDEVASKAGENDISEDENENVELLKEEIADLRQKIEGLEELRSAHAKLTGDHHDTLELVEELKAKVQSKPINIGGQLSNSSRPVVIRKHSTQLGVPNDRANRSLDLLGQRLQELASHDEELLNNLQASLAVISSEISSRSSQYNHQAAEIASLKAEVDSKVQLISGLTKAQARAPDPTYVSVLENQIAEKDADHHRLKEKMEFREIELNNKIDELGQLLDNRAKELESSKSVTEEYRRLLSEAEALVRNKRVSNASSLTSDYINGSSYNMTGTSRTEVTSDYGDHDTLDKEIADADHDDQRNLISQLKLRLEDASRAASLAAIEQHQDHARVVRDLKQELEEVKLAYEEDTSDLQRALSDVKIQLLAISAHQPNSVIDSPEVAKELEIDNPESQSTLEKVIDLKKQIAQHKNDHNEVLLLLETAQTLATEKEERANELDIALGQLKNQYQETIVEIQALKDEINSHKTNHDEIHSRLTAVQTSANEFEKNASDLSVMLEQVTKERDAHKMDQTALLKKLEDLADQHKSTIQDLEQAHEVTVDGLRKDNSEYLIIIQHLKDQVSQSEESISTHLLQITSLQQNLDAAARESEKAKKLKLSLDRELKDLHNEIANITKQRQETADKLSEVNELLEQLQDDHAALKAKTRSGKTQEDMDEVIKQQSELIEILEKKLAELETRPVSSPDPTKRLRSGSVSGRWSKDTPTPPPSMPLPPLPGSLPPPPNSPPPAGGRVGSPALTPRTSGLMRTNSQDQLLNGRTSRDQLKSPEPSQIDLAIQRQIEEKDVKLQSLEKQLVSERQLVQTLEEALGDTEKSMKQLKKQNNSLAVEKETMHSKILDMVQQLELAKSDLIQNRQSLQQLDEEKMQRQKAEAAQRKLEERMEDLSQRRKSKFLCF